MDPRALGGIERYEHRALLTRMGRVWLLARVVRLTRGEDQARQESLKS